ncbi:MAG: DEAD/DEAH box helicase [Chloroflexi bacterium]|nr:DEAD/DEAH box helicase [Chloroflexota bacterium]
MQTVFHLHWRPPAGPDTEPQFLVWAETAQAPQPARRRGRLPARPRPQPHPFTLSDAISLRELLRAFGNDLITHGAEDFILQLPSSRTGPQPSPQLIHNWELDTKNLFLAPWQIHGLRVPVDSVVSIFRQAPVVQQTADFILGTDFLFWGRAFYLVLQGLARQHYIPSLQTVEGDQAQYRPVWRPVYDSHGFHDNVWNLAKAMPPLCRSEIDEPGEAPSPLTLLQDFTATMTDFLVRQWGKNAPHRLGYLHNHNDVVTWLRGLLLPEATILQTADGTQTFIKEVLAWQRSLAPAGNTSYRIVLRLTPPPANHNHNTWHVPKKGWRLSYHLQAREDPDILVSAEQVWQNPSEMLVYRQRRFRHPQEKLLKALGQAARIFPPIERSLQAATPTYVELTTTEVYDFLRNAADLLVQSGFSLMMPPWWEEAGACLGLRLHLSPLTPHPPDVAQSSEEKERPVGYRWELVLGDRTLTQQAFAELVALRSPLVERNGRWLRLDPEQIEAAERFWNRHSFEGAVDLRVAIRSALGLDEHVDIAGLPVLRVETSGWLTTVIQRLSEGDEILEEATQPDSLQGELRPYQRYGYAWLHEHRHLGLGACLADDMGLGKSVQAIALLLREQEELGQLPAPTLLICPTSLLGNWRREIERFAPQLRVWIHYGSERLHGKAFANKVRKYDVVLTSYALARRDSETIEKIPWFGLILDEAQKIKNPNTLIHQAVIRIPSQFRFALTGTPVENHLIELWSLFHFLNKGYFGSRTSFQRQYVLPIERYRDPLAIRRLHRMVQPFILRRLKSDPTVIQDLPERLDMKVYCTLSDEQAELYQAVVEEGLPRIADSRGRSRRIHVFNLLTRLKQILNHPLHYYHKTAPPDLQQETISNRSGKLDRLTEMLEEVLDTGDKALVFTQFAEMGQLLTTHLQQTFDIPILYMYGGTPPKKRQAIINQFQDDPHSPPIFVLTLKTGGLGLNLTAAHHVFHFDRWWNPAVENQASDRAYRIGQTKNVQVHKFITAGTLEESIDEMIERKQGLSEAIVGSGEEWLATLSDDELIQLLKLQKDRL